MYKKKKKKARGYLIRVESKGGYKYGMDREEEDVTSFSLSLVCNQLRVASILKERVACWCKCARGQGTAEAEQLERSAE